MKVLLLALIATLALATPAGAQIPWPDAGPGADHAARVECGYYTPEFIIAWSGGLANFRVAITEELIFHRQKPTPARRRREHCDA